jgi:glutamate/tyrosine decarboxylase-like PLP-dependent enzyme
MQNTLANDAAHIDKILERTLEEAKQFLSELEDRPVGTVTPVSLEPIEIPQGGIGVMEALDRFKERYEPWLSGSAGPRYFGFVTGGATPAALAGDWLTSVYDQNALGSQESIAPRLELDALSLLRQLFGLPDEFGGAFVTGATMANFVGLALGRQWVGHQRGSDFAQEGLWQQAPIRILSGTPHSSVFKAAAMLGLGRQAITTLPCPPGREAVDLAALEAALQSLDREPAIVVANAGTVNTVDFDDLEEIAGLQSRYPFWLHVDAAFGGFAACSPKVRHLVRGLERADSITVDAHKWLNVPYDAAMQFTPHLELQAEVFQNTASYLGAEIGPGNFIHLTPENSRRLRALPAWFTLMAYGAQGYAEIVERDCQLAQWLGEQIGSSEKFELLAPVRMNGICFTLARKGNDVLPGDIQQYLDIVKEEGQLFLTPTTYKGIPALRLSVTNWRTTQKDVEIAWQALWEAARALGGEGPASSGHRR